MNRSAPLATRELSRQLERVSAAYLAQRYDGPGNPMGTQWLRIGPTLAHKVPYVASNPFMNSVHGLRDVAALDDVLAFYEETGQCCWIDVTPDTPIDVTDGLVERGFRPTSYSSTLYGRPQECADAGDVEIQVIDGPGLDVFLDTLNVGFDVPAAHLEDIRANQQFWIDVENWRLYLAKIGGAPAGAAVLAVTDEYGYLAVASTLPAFRRRGAHAALIARRIHDALELGCTIVCVDTPSGSASQANHQRAGLRIAHTKTIWTNEGRPLR